MPSMVRYSGAVNVCHDGRPFLRVSVGDVRRRRLVAGLESPQNSPPSLNLILPNLHFTPDLTIYVPAWGADSEGIQAFTHSMILSFHHHRYPKHPDPRRPPYYSSARIWSNTSCGPYVGLVDRHKNSTSPGPSHFVTPSWRISSPGECLEESPSFWMKLHL
jgi:hypothetical protein